MVLATTMPVYDRTPGENNQMLVGVIGTDLKIAELDDMMPVRQVSVGTGEMQRVSILRSFTHIGKQQ